MTFAHPGFLLLLLAVPLLVYAVGVQSTHAAIGTAAVAVALNALAGLAAHMRMGEIKWRCAMVFAAAGAAGAALGAELGKSFDGERLLTLFGGLMILVGLSMLRKHRGEDRPDVRLTRQSAPALLVRLLPIGFAVGLAAGFFGIGGGFLIVPAMVLLGRLQMKEAVGTSLLVIAMKSAAGFVGYLGQVEVPWGFMGLFTSVAIAGILFGAWLVRFVPQAALQRVFAVFLLMMGAFILYQNIGALRLT